MLKTSVVPLRAAALDASSFDAAAIDLPTFRADWVALRDPQGFDRLLRIHSLKRRAAVHLAAPQFAQRVDRCAARVLLDGAAAQDMQLRLCVGGVTHRGAIERVTLSGAWLRVQGSCFNVSLREDAIAEAWAVRKPSVDGLVSALELYAADGEILAQLQSLRQPERCAWRQLLDALVDDPAWSDEAVGCAA